MIRKIRSVKTKMCMIMTVNQECATIRTRIEKRDPSLCIENRLLVTHGVSCSHSRTTVPTMPLTRMIFPMNELRRTSSKLFQSVSSEHLGLLQGNTSKAFILDQVDDVVPAACIHTTNPIPESTEKHTSTSPRLA